MLCIQLIKYKNREYVGIKKHMTAAPKKYGSGIERNPAANQRQVIDKPQLKNILADEIKNHFLRIFL